MITDYDATLTLPSMWVRSDVASTERVDACPHPAGSVIEEDDMVNDGDGIESEGGPKVLRTVELTTLLLQQSARIQ